MHTPRSFHALTRSIARPWPRPTTLKSRCLLPSVAACSSCSSTAPRRPKQNNFDYASNLFGQCVVGDPGNTIYVRQYLNNLTRSYDNNPKNVSKLSSIKAAGAKTGLMNSSRQKDWPARHQDGARHSQGQSLGRFDADEHGPGMRRAGARRKPTALSQVGVGFQRQGRRRQPAVRQSTGPRRAITIRPSPAGTASNQLKPGDEEATREIGNLAVEKTIHHGGYEDAESTKDVKRAAADADDEEQAKLTPEQRVEKKIKKHPEEVSLYVELADMHIRRRTARRRPKRC